MAITETESRYSYQDSENGEPKTLNLEKAEAEVGRIFKRVSAECQGEPIEGDNLEDLNFAREILDGMRIEYLATEMDSPRKAELKRILEKFGVSVE